MDVKLIVEKGSRQTREVKLRSAETIIGRGEGCDLRIPSGQVSRRHCRLSLQDGCLMVEDLDSVNGTFVNDTRVKDSMLIQSGDLLEIGPVRFRVQYETAAPAIVMEETEPLAAEVLPDPVPAEEEALAVAEVLPDPVEAEETIPAAEFIPGPAAEAMEVLEIIEQEDKPVAKKDSRNSMPTRVSPSKSPSRKKAEDEDNPPGDISLHLPPGNDIRDILSQLDGS